MIEYEVFCRTGYMFTCTDLDEAWEEVDKVEGGYIVRVHGGQRTRLR